MKKTLVLATILTTFSQADFIGGEVNIGYYNHAPSGFAQYKGDVLDAQSDLKWESESDVFVKAYLEHPLPIIPNIKVGYTNFGHTGAGTVSKTFQFGETSFSLDNDVNTKFDLKMYDIALYYELLDNWINVDIGVNIKYLDGEIAVSGKDLLGAIVNESTDFSTPIPALYGKVRFDVPTTDLSFQVEGNYISYDGNVFYDAEAGVRYTLALGVGLEAGYKTMKIKLDNVDDITMDADFSGAYGKLVWDF